MSEDIKVTLVQQPIVYNVTLSVDETQKVLLVNKGGSAEIEILQPGLVTVVGTQGPKGVDGLIGADGIGTLESVGALFNSAEEKTDVEDADILAISDNSANGFIKKITWLNFKNKLKLYFDSIYEVVDTASQILTIHLNQFNHDKIAHANRIELDSVSGSNSGDETQSSIIYKLGQTSPTPLSISLVGSTNLYTYNDGINARSVFGLFRSKGNNTVQTSVVINNKVGTFQFSAYDGAAYQTAALLEAFVDGTPNVGSVPMRLSVVTGSSVSNRFERLVVKNTGDIGIGTTAPTSKLHVATSGNAGYPIYANNAAALAGGLTPGAHYRTGGDPDLVAIVH